MQEAAFKVPAITCAGCIGSMRFMLGRRPGVLKLDGDASTKVVRVQFDEAVTDVTAIREALDEVGFAPEE